MKQRTALWLSFCAGFIALAIEILWMRLFALSFHGTASITGFVLGLFLLGMSFGVWAEKALRFKLDLPTSEVISLLFLLSGSVDLVLGLGYLWLAPTGVSKTIVGGIILLVSGASKGAILTRLADHVGQNAHPGTWAGLMVCANIGGSTLGPLLANYLLLEFLGWQHSLCVLSILSMLCAATISTVHGVRNRATWAIMLFAGFSLLLPKTLLWRILDAAEQGKPAIVEVIENRHGIVHRVHDPRGDVIFGANLYDGRIMLDPALDLNGISRMYKAGAAVHARRRMLFIGLGSGSWLEVARRFHDVEHIDVVELNPAYAQLMRSSPSVATALNDPRIRFHYTDGRRWLHNHPEQQFDLIVLNSTFYWRAFATNLLSIEFFESLKKHLAPQGSIFLNSTESPDVIETFLAVYPESSTVGNALLGPLGQSGQNAMNPQVLAQWNAQGVPLSRPAILAELAASPLPNALAPGANIIRDDNLQSEFGVYRALSAKHLE